MKRTHPRKNAASCSRAKLYAVDQSLLPRLSDPNEFWPVIQNDARLIVSLPESSGESVRILVDHFASEARIRMPRGPWTDIDTKIETPDGVEVISCLSYAAAKTVHSRMAKRHIVALPDPTEIFTAYDRKFAHKTQLCSQTVALFNNLVTSFRNENERLLLIIVARPTSSS